MKIHSKGLILLYVDANLEICLFIFLFKMNFHIGCIIWAEVKLIFEFPPNPQFLSVVTHNVEPLFYINIYYFYSLVMEQSIKHNFEIFFPFKNAHVNK